MYKEKLGQVSEKDIPKLQRNFRLHMSRLAEAEMQYLLRTDDSATEAKKVELYAYWGMIFRELSSEEGWLMLDKPPSPESKVAPTQVPKDVVDKRPSGLFQCQSSCPAKALVRVVLHSVSMEVDLCNHHYIKLRDSEARHRMTVVVDRTCELT